MSVAIGVVSNSKSIMGFDEKNKEGEENVGEVSETKGKAATDDESGDERGGRIPGHSRHSSIAATDDEDDEERNIELGPQYSLKEQLEKDKVALFSCSSLDSIRKMQNYD